VLYDFEDGDGEVDALAAAIGHLGELSPTPEELRRRSEQFSEQHFRDRMAALIAQTAASREPGA
jgi:hypothetical protein